MEFTRKFKEQNHYSDDMINWEEVSKNWEGIEIVPYIWTARNILNWYYPWDVASGCIWNLDGISLEEIK